MVFAVDGDVDGISPHGFVKKSAKTPTSDLEDGAAAARQATRSDTTDKQHIGGDFDDYLRDQHLLDDAEATGRQTSDRLPQIAREMERTHVTKSEMAHRMKTSRPALDRLLDPKNGSVTLSTLERAASAVGKKLRVELT